MVEQIRTFPSPKGSPLCPFGLSFGDKIVDYENPYATHGAGILFIPTFAQHKSPSYVGKYSIHGAYG